ncbi:MAG: hypothetical protein COV70_01200 [Parcubacteria group bacterium CG11_big_fil_rev_8_21_14_0_20_39_22]|nr:MAG: hypothetical protein COV70_01200 [Parcubacteria group bacterium CG11_big_fil_rev_8_21_14_0_20_39_22]
MKKLLIVLVSLVTVTPKVASAHCPLCTAGAGALAILAASLGVSSVVVGVLIGAFSLALGLWISEAIKKQYIPYQKHILTSVIFLGTVIPIMPFIRHYGPLYVPFIGEYGTTYTIDLYMLGVIIGSAIMLFSPFLSKFVTRVRNKQMPFQGLSITILLLVIVSVIIQLVSL